MTRTSLPILLVMAAMLALAACANKKNGDATGGTDGGSAGSTMGGSSGGGY